MSDYPTRGTRDGSKSGGFGFPGSASLSGLAVAGGFLSPGTRRALAAAGPTLAEALQRQRPINLTRPLIRLPVVQAAELASANIARTALAGLLPVALRALPYVALAYAAYQLYEWYVGYRATVDYAQTFVAGGFTRTGLCTSESINYQGAKVFQYQNGTIAPGAGSDFATNCVTGLSGANMGTLSASTRGVMILKRRSITPNPSFAQCIETWSRPLAGPAPYAPYFFPQPTLLEDFEYGYADPIPGVDPMSETPGNVPWRPAVMPFEALPGRVENPYRSSIEQSHRGYAIPAGRGPLDMDEIVLPQELSYPRYTDPEVPPSFAWPLEVPEDAYEVQTQTSPQEVVSPATVTEIDLRPQEFDLLSDYADPETIGKAIEFVEPGVPTVTEELPAGAAGPTIIIGGGNTVGPHDKAPPGNREKERKARYVKHGSFLARSGIHKLLIGRGVNPVTEALEALDCVYKSLSKKTKWSTQKADWKRQQAKAVSEGYKIDKKPNRIKDSGPRIKIGNVPGAQSGEDARPQQSITLPGSTRRYVDVDLSKHYMKGLSPQEKAKAIYRHYDEIDIPWMVECIALDQIEDRIFGTIGRGLAKRVPLKLPGGRLVDVQGAHGRQQGPVF